MALLTALMHPPHEVLSVVAAAPAWVKDREREMERIQCPVLLIWGSADSVVPLQDGVAYSRRIKGCKLEVIQGAGHPPSYLDAPERFAEVLKASTPPWSAGRSPPQSETAGIGMDTAIFLGASG
ncbi:alpha/beta hydrolase [Thermogymnomonas acidicola]|uniref:alpha/beta fold hydrolase n=1 Tax=Thermogymnomonas acidicola TaxID=399579 RepID=UPI000946412D|nr:alpha/beta hydrolase [Thermogymnomonas acidicola]